MMMIIRDYKSVNSRVNAKLILLLYVCVAHTHELDPTIIVRLGERKKKFSLSHLIRVVVSSCVIYSSRSYFHADINARGMRNTNIWIQTPWMLTG